MDDRAWRGGGVVSAPTVEQRHREAAAQLWCLPQHAAKQMDSTLAESVAEAFAAAEARGIAIGMEKAATVCDAKEVEHVMDDGDPDWSQGYERGIQDAAAAIREVAR